MVKRILGWAAVLVCVGALAWLAVTLWPSPEKHVRKRLRQLAELASVSASEAELARLANARALSFLFATNAVIRVDVQGGPHGQLSGREEIFQVALGARQALGALHVEFLDVEVQLSADRRLATVEATGKATQPGVREVFWQELRFRFRLQDNGWVIESVETVRTLTSTPRVNSLMPPRRLPA